MKGTYTLEEKSVVGVFTAQGKTKSEIHSLINDWISTNHNSPSSRIILNDSDAGNIIVTGITDIWYTNHLKSAFDTNKGVPSKFLSKFNHSIEIYIRDGGYDVTYRLVETTLPNGESLMSLIDFKNGVPQQSSDELNVRIQNNLDRASIDSQKISAIKALTRVTYQKLNDDLIDKLELTMESIHEIVNVKI